MVGNGADVTGLPAGVRAISPAGERRGRRRAATPGWPPATGDVVLFLDDDGWYPDPGLGAHIAARFAADPALAVLSFQVVDPDGGPGARWHVPRLRAGDPERSSVVTTFLGGACAIRRSAYTGGGRPAGPVLLRARGDRPGLAADGPRLPAGVRRHGPDVPPLAAERPARHVPPPGRAEPGAAGPAQPALAAGRGLPGRLDGAHRGPGARPAGDALRPWFAGFAEGWRTDPGPRRPISLRTAWRMARAGRPPVI